MKTEIDEYYRIPLTSAEASATLTAVKAIRSLLRPEVDSTFVPGILEAIIDRISDELPEFIREGSERMAGTLAIDVIESVAQAQAGRVDDVIEPPFPAGPTRMRLLDAQKQGNAVEIEYYVRSRNEWTRRNVDIEKIYVNGDAWCLSGHCRLRDDFRVFRLENIRSVRVLDGDSMSTAWDE